jgi:tRNA C32,U32 (ribose-2'-O)-methylase TrmJ
LIAVRAVQCRFDFAVEPYHRAEDVADLLVLVEHLDEALEHVRLAQAVVRRDQPHVVALRHADADVVVAQMADVLGVAHVADARVGEARRHLRGAIGRAVIHDQDFEVLERLRKDRVDAVRQEVRQTVARDHERYTRHDDVP